MITNIILFGIYDTVAKGYQAYFTFPNKELAERYFINEVCSKSYYSADLRLYQLAQIDTVTGVVVPCLDFVQGGVDNVKA